MFLIIPNIPIVEGHCGDEIGATQGARHRVNEIYSEDPVERARLFRKENAKMIHLEFIDAPCWEERSLAVIRRIREAVDIPVEISLAAMPKDERTIRTLFEAGINRVFLPRGVTEDVLCELVATHGRKVLATFAPNEITPDRLNLLRKKHIDRVGIQFPSEIEDGSGQKGVDRHWEQLASIAASATLAGIRLTALIEIVGYPDLHRLQSLGPALDSLVLGRALNENRFPCQMIWRELEAEFADADGTTSILWTNPLADKPHV